MYGFVHNDTSNTISLIKLSALSPLGQQCLHSICVYGRRRIHSIETHDIFRSVVRNHKQPHIGHLLWVLLLHITFSVELKHIKISIPCPSICLPGLTKKTGCLMSISDRHFVLRGSLNCMHFIGLTSTTRMLQLGD